MGAPKYQQPQIDPMLAPLMAQGQQQDVEAIQQQLRGDTASLLARYGAQLTAAQNPDVLGAASAVTPTYGKKVA